MTTFARTLTVGLAALILSLGASPAEAQAHAHRGGHSWHGHGHHGHGRFWGGVGIGIGLGYVYRPWYPGYVVVEPSPTVYYGPTTDPRVPASAPDPIFYPRNGQSSQQVEADRQSCNRWATTQPNAMADASIFHRATLACMEGRGYAVK